MTDFAKFIDHILTLAGIGPENRRKMTSPQNLAKFRTAFTHKTVNSGNDNNYELYELLGDSLVNAAILRYVNAKRPDISDVETLTRIKHYIQSRAFLSILAFQNGYFQHVLVGEEFAKSIVDGVEKKLRRQDREQRVMSEETRKVIIQMGEDGLKDNKTFSKLMTDLYEAMCGVIASLVEEETGIEGMGYIPVYQLTSNFLSRSNMELTYENIVDPVTRLKETYQKIKYRNDQGEEKGWNFGNMKEIERLPNGRYKVTIFGYFGKTKNPEYEPKVVLAVGEGKDSDSAQKQAAEKGLQELQKYGIHEYRKLRGFSKKT
ncbi:putative ribonuclease III [Golden Marseillevirus]|uniref:putative ribonuclease III n=1 Tax=Golden Marseillevirus TaxID=1720526 RepID=UPI000877AB86|nr:putative ribonuclease III [Golden Marseillevirus]ALX27533.1 putative ribonuclease III [Golden Marseillevirus]